MTGDDLKTPPEESGDDADLDSRPDSRSGEARWIVGILALALVLRLFMIWRESAWGDEAYTLLAFPADDLRAFLNQALQLDPMPAMNPVYHVLAYAWASLLGASLFSLRMLSVLCGVATIGFVYGIGKRLIDARAGLYAAALLSVSLVHVYYSQEVRFYALTGLLASVSMYALVRGAQRGGPRWWVLHGLANVVLAWTHVLAPLAFIPQALYLLANFRAAPTRFWRWCGAHAALLIALGVWLSVTYPEHTGELFREAPPTWREAAAAAVVFTGGRVAQADPTPYMMGASLDLPIAAASAALLCVAVFVGLRRSRNEENNSSLPAIVLLVTWAALPLAILFAVSFVWKSVFFYRYALHSVCAVSLLVGMGVSAIPRDSLRRIAIGVMLGALLYQNLTLARPIRPDYRAMAAKIEDDSARPVLVLALKQFNALGVEYALRDTDLPFRWHQGYTELVDATVEAAQGGTEVWVIFHRWDKLEDFEQQIGNAGLEAHGRAWPGQPRLNGYRVVASPEE